MVSYFEQIKMRNMGNLRAPQLVTPLVAVLSGHMSFFEAAIEPLEGLLGPIEFESPLYPFNVTEYYVPTMGSGVQRKFFSFANLADPGGLVDWKLAANRIEVNLKDAAQVTPGTLPPRPINLDPGYVTGAKLVLASTKDFAHRLYLRDGIYAEMTLSYRTGGWVGHQFTFPDFKSGIYNDFLSQVRERHLQKLRNS